MKPPIDERELSPDQREFLRVIRQIPKATLDEVWRLVALINQGSVPVGADPNILRFAEMIAEAERDKTAKITHPFDPDRTIGGSP